MLASVGGDGTSRLWDLRPREVAVNLTGAKQRRYWGRETSLLDLATTGFSWASFAEDGKNIVGTTADRAIVRWKPGSRNVKLVLTAPGNLTNAQTVSSDGRFLAELGDDGVLNLLDLSRGVVVPGGWRSTYRPPSLQFWPGTSTLLALNDSNRLDYWDAKAGQKLPAGAGLKRHQGMARRYWACFDGALGGSFAVLVWEVPTGRLVRRFEEPANALALSPDGRYLALAAQTGALELVEVASGKSLARQWTTDSLPTVLEFSPNGRLLAAGYPNGNILLWDMIQRTPQVRFAAGDIAKAWKALAADEPDAAFAAIGTLTANPGDALPFIHTRLRAPGPVNREHIDALVARLDHARFAVREQATRELLAVGANAEAALEEALGREDASVEVCMRAEKILESIQRAPMTGERLRFMRVIELLERIGGTQAEGMLKELTRSGDAQLVRAANDSLFRLQKAAK
jgi:hypothetical protein